MEFTVINNASSSDMKREITDIKVHWDRLYKYYKKLMLIINMLRTTTNTIHKCVTYYKMYRICNEVESLLFSTQNFGSNLRSLEFVHQFIQLTRLQNDSK